MSSKVATGVWGQASNRSLKMLAHLGPPRPKITTQAQQAALSVQQREEQLPSASADKGLQVAARPRLEASPSMHGQTGLSLLVRLEADMQLAPADAQRLCSSSAGAGGRFGGRRGGAGGGKRRKKSKRKKYRGSAHSSNAPSSSSFSAAHQRAGPLVRPSGPTPLNTLWHQFVRGNKRGRSA